MGGPEKFTRSWLSVAIGLTVAVAALFPGPGQRLLETPLIDFAVMAVFFLGSLKIDPKHFLGLARRLHLLAASLVSLFVVAPAVSLFLGDAFGFGDWESRSAVLICASAATTIATAFVLTEVAGGDGALAMSISVISNMLAIFFIPVIFHLAVGSDVALDTWRMIRGLSLKVLLPLLMAQIARTRLKRWAHRHGNRISLFNQTAILLFVYAGVAAAWPLIRAQGATLVLRLFAFVAVVHASLLAFNAVCARFLTRDPATRAALVLASSQKNLSVSILVWKDHFTHLYFGPLVAVAYHMFQLVLDSIIAPGLKQCPLIRSAGGRERKEGQDGTVSGQR